MSEPIELLEQRALAAFRDCQRPPLAVEERILARLATGAEKRMQTRPPNTQAWIVLGVAAAMVLIAIGFVVVPDIRGEARAPDFHEALHIDDAHRVGRAQSRSGSAARGPALSDQAQVGTARERPDESTAARFGADEPVRTTSDGSSRRQALERRDQREEAPVQDEPMEGLLHRESTMLRPAHEALAVGDHAAVLERVATYQKRFPAGMLAEEASALRVLALCRAGNLVQGRGEGKAFLRERPRSVFVERIRRACTFDP